MLLRVACIPLAGLLAVAACAPGQDDGDENGQGAPAQEGKEGPASLVVWTDAGRQPGFEAYQEAHPEVELTIETRPDDFLEQLALANQAGQGWPDVLFPGPVSNVLALQEEPLDFAADISEFVPQEILDGYASGILNNCLGDSGELLCLRNDIGPLVLWYDAELMDEFGYDIPTTWEEYEQLALRLANEHPGYVAGGIPPGAGRSEMAASRCPMYEIVDHRTIRVDLQDPKCTRVASLFDNLIAAEALAPFSFLSPEFAAEYGIERKVLMQVIPIYWVNLFRDSFELPEGTIGLAPPLRWQDEDRIYNYSQGGGHYVVSRHTEFPQAAVDLVLWMVSGPYQTDPETITLPAYGPAQMTWIENHTGAFTAAEGDVAGVVELAIDSLWEEWRDVPIPAVYSSAEEIVVPAVIGEGRTITEMLPAWEERIINEAEAAGWTVENS